MQYFFLEISDKEHIYVLFFSKTIFSRSMAQNKREKRGQMRWTTQRPGKAQVIMRYTIREFKRAAGTVICL